MDTELGNYNNGDLGIDWYAVVDISAVRFRSDFIYEGFYKYDIVHEEDFNSNLCSVNCTHLDYKIILMTLNTSLYPSLQRTQVFGDQETKLLYLSSTSSIKFEFITSVSHLNMDMYLLLPQLSLLLNEIVTLFCLFSI